MDVNIALSVIDELNELVTILYEKEYFGFIDSAHAYVDKLKNYAKSTIPNGYGKKSPEYFKRYATHYVTYRPNKKTNWYIFFIEKNDLFIITYITNNHVKGHHIRGLK